MTRPVIYLAGFDVFRPDAQAFGLQLKAECARFGFRGIFPLDPPLAKVEYPLPRPKQIYHSNIASIRCADVVMANISDFRGTGEPDCGTAFEIGFATALGKPVFAYIRHAEPLVDRVPKEFDGLGRPVCDRGYVIEDFGLTTNLMIACSTQIIVGGPTQCLMVFSGQIGSVVPGPATQHLAAPPGQR